jgi:hypothetical protein
LKRKLLQQTSTSTETELAVYVYVWPKTCTYSVLSSLKMESIRLLFFCQPHTPQLLFVLGGKEVGGLLVIILQF